VRRTHFKNQKRDKDWDYLCYMTAQSLSRFIYTICINKCMHLL
jgi:hypothetical protein